MSMVADKTCPASGKVGKRSGVEDFKLPLPGTFKSHPGGQEHLKTAARPECLPYGLRSSLKDRTCSQGKWN